MADKLYFCGDLLLPFDCTVDYRNVASLMADGVGVANLEGAILENEEETHRIKWRDKSSMFSCKNVLEIIKNLNIRYVSLCNNHILDFKQPIEKTEQLLDKNGIQHWGLKNHDVLKTEFKDADLFFVTFATYANEHSLNLFNPVKVIKEVENIRSSHPSSRIVIFPHWGVEQFFYPEPGDRILAHKLIDAGADLIIGHHPHVIQPIEKYNGKYIVYSIGNFIFPQVRYGEQYCRFKKDEILDELIVEWDGENIKLHPFRFDRDANILTSNPAYNLSPIYKVFDTPLTVKEYRRVFKSHASLKDSLIKTRYSATMGGERKVYVLRRALRNFRRLLMDLKLYDPRSKPPTT